MPGAGTSTSIRNCPTASFAPRNWLPTTCVSLGLEVTTGIAGTGVLGVLQGGKPGPVVALRADMDGLPVVEQTGLPYASRETGTYLGQEVGVMHACGHDNHVAILMGVATVLSGMRERLPGTVKFIFQPAEEGAPPGEEGGAEVMVREGVMGKTRTWMQFSVCMCSRQGRSAPRATGPAAQWPAPRVSTSR